MPDDLDMLAAREAALIAARVAHAQRQLAAVDARDDGCDRDDQPLRHQGGRAQ
jgi:hypothetical protein